MPTADKTKGVIKKRTSQEAPKVKRKKSTSKSLVIPDSSILSEGIEVIKAIPDSVKQENEQLIEYIKMFKRLRYMARTLEKRFKENPSSQTVYALLKVYDQVREVIADMRAMRDVQQMGETLNREVLTPFTKLVAAALAGIHQNLKADIKNAVPEAYIASVTSLVETQIAKAARDVNESYNNSLIKTIEVFGGGL